MNDIEEHRGTMILWLITQHEKELVRVAKDKKGRERTRTEQGRVKPHIHKQQMAKENQEGIRKITKEKAGHPRIRDSMQGREKTTTKEEG